MIVVRPRSLGALKSMTTSPRTFALALALACLSACEYPIRVLTTQDASAVDAGAVDAGAHDAGPRDAGPSDAGTDPLAEGARSLARAQCERARECSPAGFRLAFLHGMEQCLRNRAALHLDRFRRGLAPRDLAGCIEQVRANACEGVPWDGVGVCHPPPGDAELGEPCRTDHDCGYDELGYRMHCSYSDEDACVPMGVCRARVGEGCLGSEECDWERGEACLGDERTCVVPVIVGIGEACGGARLCDVLARCVAGTCEARPREGEPCDLSFEGRCVGGDTVCDEGVCRTMRADEVALEGEPCEAGQACAGAAGACPVDGRCPSTCDWLSCSEGAGEVCTEGGTCEYESPCAP